MKTILAICALSLMASPALAQEKWPSASAPAAKETGAVIKTVIGRAVGPTPQNLKPCLPGEMRVLNDCVVEGQLKVGEKLPTHFKTEKAPDSVKKQFPLQEGYSYIYNKGVVYKFDKTSLKVVSMTKVK
jgi:hypothetical protein